MPKLGQFGYISFRSQVIMMTPPQLRSVTMIDFAASLVSPLDVISSRDWRFIYDQYTKGHLTGQKMIMQEGLNYLFRISSEPFIIIETVRGEGGTLYAFNEIEIQETFAFNEGEGNVTYTYNESESQGGDYDFVVKMPTIYATQENLDKLAKQVDIIKLTGTTYQIITY